MNLEPHSLLSWQGFEEPTSANHCGVCGAILPESTLATEQRAAENTKMNLDSVR